LAFLLGVGPPAVLAATNRVLGGIGGINNGTITGGDGTGAAAFTINSTASGAAVESLIAEINPGTVIISAHTSFTATVQASITAGNSGVDQVTITIPATYTNIIPGAVFVNSTVVPAGACPVPGGGTQCTQLSGSTLTITFADRITADANVRIDFSADPPATAGNSTFSIAVDDTVTGAPPVTAPSGDADATPSNNNSLDVTISSGLDPFRSTLAAQPIIVVADGLSTSTVSATLFDIAGLPLTGETVALASDRGGIDTIIQPGVTNISGIANGSITSLSPGVTTLTATGGGTLLNQTATVYFTQGLVMNLRKSANKEKVQIGDVITYRVELRNLTTRDILLAELTDELPPNFVYRAGSARLDGVVMADPAGVRRLSFPIGTVAALVDSNGNGSADPGEAGYHEISYQLIVSAGATPGTYVNSAYASDVCVTCPISNRAEYPVDVTLDPLFDLGTIIGKVFEDKNENGLQERDEPGIPGAMVALDNGSYVKTDPYGRYHFPAVEPGERLLKINLGGLGNGARATTWEALTLSVTPGLLTKANFGVITRLENSTIGQMVEYGLKLEVDEKIRPIDIHGNVSGQYLLINGRSVQLPGSDIRLQRDTLDEVVNVKGDALEKPITFTILNQDTVLPRTWSLKIYDSDESIVRSFSGEGVPANLLTWDGRLDSGGLVKGGSIYHYQLENQNADGTTTRSPRRLFGVDRTSAITMNLSGSSFVAGSDNLSLAARQALGEAARILRHYPHEKILIEGHSDSTGSAASNLKLSLRRAQAALFYLTENEKLPAERFVTKGYGEERPLVSNLLPEGRELNRRVEIKGDYEVVERAQLLDQYRTLPQVAINGFAIAPDQFGRFQTAIDGKQDELTIELNDEQGRTLQKRVKMPTCNIRAPIGLQLFPYGQKGPDETETALTKETALDAAATLIRTRLRGQTEPGNTVQLDGQPIKLDANGSFTALLNLQDGLNVAGLTISNADGITRLADLRMTVKSREELGGYVIFSEPIPYLFVQMPPTDRPLSSELFIISGNTAAVNRVSINKEPIELDAGGNFSYSLTLPQGTSRLNITVEDPQGHTGEIDREVEVNDSPLFLLAFADSKISRLTTSGNLTNAGRGGEKEIVTEGRVALYLKGRIAGRYLLTAAFDTGTEEFSDLFKDLDHAETDHLLTNLDPDRLYPVYGDSSTLVNDTESQGKLYLALDSDELHLLIGNYSLNLHGTELASYRRTLFGGHAVYRSADQSTYGQPVTEIELFGAENRQVHVRDEVNATGGALYYLSRSEVIEGSEQVTIVVRDSLTGLPLARLPQERNIDYSIKYPEGRILFRRPVSAVQSAARLITQGLLSGNPVSIQIDYEATADSFEKNAYGGRVRQQLGDQIAVGLTAVQDETGDGPYELLGIDTEIRFGKGTRLLTEYATSNGSEALVNISHDGGLNYTAVAASGIEEGEAWKAAAEFDIGAWFDHPDFLQTTLYHKQLDSGFRAAGQTAEAGTQKSGAELLWRPRESDSFLFRFDREKRDNTTALVATMLQTTMLQWRYEQRNWRLLTEFEALESEDVTGQRLTDDQLAALRLEIDLTDRLTGSVAQQLTLSGTKDNRTTLGLDYRPVDPLSLFASATTGTLGRSAEGGVSLLLDKSRIYLTQRLMQEAANHESATILGGENQNGPYGSRLYTEYQINRATAGTGSVSLFGAEKKWHSDKGLQLLIGGEMSEAKRSTEETSQYSLASGLTYRYTDRFKLSLRGEFREQEGTTTLQQFLTVNQAEGKLTPDLTLIGLYRYSVSDNRTTGLKEAGFEEASVGLAFRPTENDFFNALARATRLTDRRPTETGSTDYLDTVLDTLSFEFSLQLTEALEWVEKNAVRWKEETDATDSFSSRAWLSLHRFNYLFTKSIDSGLEYRWLTESSTYGKRQGWLAELGWRPKKAVRLGVGYNFTDFSDDERSLNNYSVQGWFVRVQGIY